MDVFVNMYDSKFSLEFDKVQRIDNRVHGLNQKGYQHNEVVTGSKVTDISHLRM